ncbi:arca-like protein [Seiridium cupressi]
MRDIRRQYLIRHSRRQEADMWQLHQARPSLPPEFEDSISTYTECFPRYWGAGVFEEPEMVLYDERLSPVERKGFEGEKDGIIPPTHSSSHYSPNDTTPSQDLQPGIGGQSHSLTSPVINPALDSVHGALNTPSFIYNDSPAIQRTLFSDQSDGFGDHSPTAVSKTIDSSIPPALQGTLCSHTKVETHPLLRGQPTLLDWCNKQGADLLRHFVETLSPVFDCGSYEKSFATTIPNMATEHRPLLKIIAAISALSLKLMGFPKLANASQFYLDSYNHGDIAEMEFRACSDMPQLLTSILYKLYDDLERNTCDGLRLNENPAGLRYQQMMQLDRITLHDEVEQDINWASLRIRLYFAVINQEPDYVILDIDPADFGLDQGNDDHHWALRITLHLHNVVNYCFGDENDATTYQELVAYAQDWVTSKPPSFDPIFIEDRKSGDGFPDIFVLSESIALGWQLYHLSRILLVAHDPNRPRLGPGGALARRTIDADQGSPSPFRAACMAIALTGNLFTKDSEQVALLDILAQTEKTFGWPTSTIQSHLRDTWEL